MLSSSADPVRFTEWVSLGDDRSYPVLIGPGAVEDLATLIPPSARRAAIVTQSGIGVTVDPGVDHKVFLVPDGEPAKSLDVLATLLSSFAQWGLNRNDVVVAVGGGVVTDLGGFAAASYHRGIPVIHVSTTLLGQVDAAIGGKCGVNLPEGKNLVGAFWQPRGVICDTDTLSTLPPREYAGGLGEMAKYHFIGQEVLQGRRFEDMSLPERIAASVRIKADVVASDEREGGRRAILNYGHTLAHALETATDYAQLRHGEAVAIGLIYAAELAHLMGRIDAARVAQHHTVLEEYSLSPALPANVDPAMLIELFHRDKKALTGITFVLDGPQGVEVVPVTDRSLLEGAMAAMPKAT